MAELLIPITSEFKGKKAFKDADNATGVLDKSVKKLGATLLGVFGAQQMTRYAKNGIAAFAENEKSARRLESVVKNLGLSFEIPGIEASLDRVSRKFGYEGEVLREAFQKLITTTGSAKKSQDLLNLSLNIAAGSGVDLLTVNQDLAAAYVGQTRGLRKYNLGLTQSELKTLDFDSAVSKLTANFKGAAGAELDTYSGKLRVLQEAADNAQEIIGGALLDSLVSVFAAGDTTKFVNQIDALATKIADTVATVVFGFQKLYVLTSDRAILASFNPFDDYEKNALAAIEAAEKAAKLRRNMPSMGYQGSQPMGIYETSAQRTARIKAERDAARRAKELAALQRKALDTQKKQNALTKASQTLDLERISIAAALKGQISETDRLSLNLQLALLNKNDAVATKLAAELELSIQRQNALAAALKATPEAPNPYRNWVIPGMSAITAQAPASIGGGGVIPDFNVPANSFSQVGPMGGLGAGVIAGVNPAPVINVVVEVAGEEVAAVITQQQTNKSLSGSFVGVNRTARFGTRVDEG
jgi:uncharacterized protein Yka (UPF0111/DUF47 family)